MTPDSTALGLPAAGAPHAHFKTPACSPELKPLPSRSVAVVANLAWPAHGNANEPCAAKLRLAPQAKVKSITLATSRINSRERVDHNTRPVLVDGASLMLTIGVVSALGLDGR